MGFIGIYRAVYDYTPTGEDELEVSDGDLLFVQEKGDDDWWKAKKKAQSEDEEEPEGLIPSNYVEEAKPTGTAKALYDYTRQTDEELSFAEDAVLDVYDSTDPDWTLVGINGEYGFAPANYIDVEEAAPPTPARPRAVPDPEPEPEPEYEPARPEPPTPTSPESHIPSPAAALAGIIQSKSTARPNGTTKSVTIASPPLPARQPVYTPPEEEEEEAPAPRLPSRPLSQSISPPAPTERVTSPRSPDAGVLPSPPYNRVRAPSVLYDDDRGLASPAGFHLYNIYEMVEVMGKNKKMPVTLGINVAKGVIMISPEQARDSKEWSADKLTHYALEGKHVFMELVRPSKSIDFHAGAKDTAQEIVSHLGELAGAVKAEGLREIISAGERSRQKKGKMLYDFMAAGDDEVTVAADDDVIVLDDSKSDEWWMVRRLKNGKEGVVPSNYVEITGTIVAPPSTATASARSFVEQNRMEEERLAREASRSKRASKAPEVGPGLQLPERGSSLSQHNDRRKSKRQSRDVKSPVKKSMPDSSKIRTWTDRSGSFKVEAEFLGLKDGKIHLHKLNGVKIAVPVAKMSVEDLEYVEWAAGVSLDEDKPLSDIKRKGTRRDNERAKPGASVEKEYDWFDFFLQCGVNYQICERYAASFHKDQMGEESLEDISPVLLRNLGLKEGDILRVMKFLDSKFNRTKKVSFGDEGAEANGESSRGGLFSGPGGALRNNTRKGRPAPPVETKNTVDEKVFEQKTEGSKPSDATPTPLANAPAPKKDLMSGFDDNAWEPRASKSPPANTSAPPPASQAATSAPAPAPAPAPAQAPTGAQADLSLLQAPLQPTPAPAPQPAPVQTSQETAATTVPTAPQGATQSLFEQLVKSPANPLNQQQTLPRQRPHAPMQTGQNSLIAPPPPRAASAPHNFTQQSAFGPPPLQPQLTGYQQPQPTGFAPPGQSMQEQMQRLQLQQQQQNFMQQQQQLGSQPTGFGGSGFGGSNPIANGIMPQQTGFPGQQFPQIPGFNPQVHQQQLLAGAQAGSPFADPPRLPYQATGFQSLQPQQAGVNAFLPPALMPQPTGAPSTTFSPPPVPPIPQQTGGLQPLMPQKTGPPPPVRFGVQPGQKKLAPQPTGRRANLAYATPQNPFGF